MKNSIILLIALIGLFACKSVSEEKPKKARQEMALNQQSIKKIDVHAHYKYERDYLSSFFKKWNMQAILVDVAMSDSNGIKRSWNNYMEQQRAQPDLFFLCSSLIGVGIDAPDFATKAIAQVEEEISSGATMVKVWKNFGMVTKDASGKFIQIDDMRLQPIWDFLVDRNIPVMAHIGEPVQAWRPLDDPHNPHYGYYTEHPEYHAYQHPEVPTYETIIAARDRWIANNPKLKILCAHLGSMAHDVGMVAERLDTYPNIYVEPAARFGDLVGQNSEKVKAFFVKYQDRIMFGTDYGTWYPKHQKTVEEIEQENQELDASYALLWTYLSSADSVALRGQKNTGLALPVPVLKKIYYQNAVNFLQLDSQ